MNSIQLRNPFEIPLYVLSVLVNLLIIGFILIGALLLGYLNALAGEPLSGPVVDTIRVAFLALLLLVPGLVVYRQLTRAGTRGSAVRLSPRQFPDIYAVKDDFARRLNLRKDPEIYLMSGNGALNAFAASTFGYDFVVIHSELFSNTYERNKDALAFIMGHELGHLRLGHTRLWYQLSTAYVDRVPLLGGFLSRAREFSCDRHGAYLAPRGEEGLDVAGCRAIRLQRSGRRGALGASAAVPGVLAGGCPASPIASFHSASTKGLVRRRVFRSI
jgi:Zn-dependent protease with chaperone function